MEGLGRFHIVKKLRESQRRRQKGLWIIRAKLFPPQGREGLAARGHDLFAPLREFTNAWSGDDPPMGKPRICFRAVGRRASRFEDLDNDIVAAEHFAGTISEDEASASDSPEQSRSQTGGILE